jgi:hypothetical protein
LVSRWRIRTTSQRGNLLWRTKRRIEQTVRQLNLNDLRFVIVKFE